MSALLRARHLILNVDTGSALLDEHLGELHDGGETSVTGVGVGDDRTKVVDVGRLGAFLRRETRTLLTLLAVVEELSHEEMLDLVGDGVGGVVGEVGSRFVARRSGRRALPSRDVNGVEVLGHLGDLDGVEPA